MRMNMPLIVLLSAAAVFPLAGCGGTGGVTMRQAARLSDASTPEVRAAFATEPASPFPANIAVVHVQQAQSNNVTGMRIEPVRDIETEDQLRELASWPMVGQVAPLNRLLVPNFIAAESELRAAAGSMHADMLLIYTLSTDATIDDFDIGPLGIVLLGFAPNQFAKANTTVSAIIVDVRTGFVYGSAEFTATAEKIANAYSKWDARDDCTRTSERKALAGLLPHLETTWTGIVNEYAGDAKVN